MKKEPEIVVLDSCPNYYLFKNISTNALCSIYWDMALFIKTLYSNFNFYFKFKKYIDIFVEDFLKGYEEKSGFTIDRPTVFVCAGSVLNIYKQFRLELDKQFRKKFPLDAFWRNPRDYLFRSFMTKKIHSSAEKELKGIENRKV